MVVIASICKDCNLLKLHQAKGLKTVLEEWGFNVKKLWAKCKPVCPIENKDCCMAWLLSNQDDFKNQVSMLEELVKRKGHKIIFLPKFHCELNPIEMVHSRFFQVAILTQFAVLGMVQVPISWGAQENLPRCQRGSDQASWCVPTWGDSEIHQPFLVFHEYILARFDWESSRMGSQRSHQAVSQSAMMALKSVLN